MNRKLIGIALLLLFANFVYAEEQQANFLVIEGNSRVSNEEIVEYSGFQVGKIYNNEDISNIIKNLFSTNLFVDIKVNLDQNTLYISVVETPIISRINIDGNKLVETEQIISSLKSVGISQSKPYSKNLVDKVQQELTRLYYDNGRYSSSIDITENTLDDNLLELDINIDEGTASTIKEVKILGNKSFSTRQLKSIIKSGPKYWFEVWSSKDIYNSSLLDQDVESLLKYYQDRGYAKVKLVSKQVNLSSDKSDIFITISLSEGRLYQFGNTKVYGLEEFDSQLFKDILNFNLRPGSIFSRANIENAEQSIKFVLGESGYAFPDIIYNADFKDDKSAVDINFRVNPKAKSYVRRINIIGNTKTNDEVYRRELRQFESSIYAESKIDRSKIRLQRLKFVNNVEVKKTIVDESLGLIDIDFIVEETQSGEFKVGAGYSDSSGAVFNIKVQQDNFLGKGNNVALELEKTNYKKLIRYSNTNPYYTNDGMSKTTSLVFSDTDVSGTSTASYLSDTYSYGVNYSVPISETKSFGYGGELLLTDYTTTIGSPSNVTRFIDDYGEFTLDLDSMQVIQKILEIG